MNGKQHGEVSPDPWAFGSQDSDSPPQLLLAHPTLISWLPSLSFYMVLSVFLYNETAEEPTWIHSHLRTDASFCLGTTCINMAPLGSTVLTQSTVVELEPWQKQIISASDWPREGLCPCSSPLIFTINGRLDLSGDHYGVPKPNYSYLHHLFCVSVAYSTLLAVFLVFLLY